MLEHVMNLPQLGHDRLKQVISALRGEAQGGLATTLTSDILRGPCRDAHAADAAPVEFDHFDTNPSTGNAQISAVVGAGNDVTLFATTSATNEAGHIVIQRGALWSLAAGAGGAQGWGLVEVSYGITSSPYQPIYTATQGTGYGAIDNFAIDYTKHMHKPLHGRTLDSGGGITVRLIVRPLGPAGSTVIWPGADLQAISSAACTLIQKMQLWGPADYGPIHLKEMFAGGKTRSGTGRKSLIRQIFGGGRIGQAITGVRHLIDEPPSRIQ